ncbi:MAG TPA: nucleotidyltransferase family protein [Dehalococcoidia bacterium]|nr:nucleotidyltransferase family protein [Dehalococcoidia bacterium]
MSEPVAIVLAAGAGTRMGQPKALLPWGIGTLLGYQLRELAAAGFAERIVVAGAAAPPVADITVKAGAALVVNTAWEEGRASSLRVGADAVRRDRDPILVLNVDQPRPAPIHAGLLGAYRDEPAPIIVPVFQGRRGHPIILSGALLDELRTVRDEERGLRAVVERHSSEVREIDLGDRLITIDINTPEEYEEARRIFEALAAEGTTT